VDGDGLPDLLLQAQVLDGAEHGGVVLLGDGPFDGATLGTADALHTLYASDAEPDSAAPSLWSAAHPAGPGSSC
jgi:hypothetical protein